MDDPKKTEMIEVPDFSKTEVSESAPQNRPTADNPNRFGFEEATRVVTFSQVSGEKLRGVVSGYYLDDEGQRINLVQLTNASAEAAGLEPGKEMAVPEWALKQPEVVESTPEEEPKVVLTEAQTDVADEAIEIVAGIEDPADVEDDPLNKKVTWSEIKRMQAERDAAERILGDAESSVADARSDSQEAPVLETLEQRIEEAGLSDDDKHHMQGYASAREDMRDAQKERNGQGSRDAQERMAFHRNGLVAPKAKELLDEYTAKYLRDRQ